MRRENIGSYLSMLAFWGELVTTVIAAFKTMNNQLFTWYTDNYATVLDGRKVILSFSFNFQNTTTSWVVSFKGTGFEQTLCAVKQAVTVTEQH